MRVATTVNLHILEFLLGMRTGCTQLGYSVYHIYGQSEAVCLVVNGQFHRSIDVAPFLVAPDMQMLVVRPVVGEPVDQPGIAMEVENDRFVDSKQTVKVSIA